MAAGMVLQAGVCFAQDNVLNETGGHWAVGTEMHHFRYEEPGLIEEEGFMYGVFGQYTYRTQQNEPLHHIRDLISAGHGFNIYTLDARFTFGQIDYDSQGTGSIDNINDFLTEVRVLAGYDVPVGSSLVTPYFGFGYRYWLDELGGKVSTTGHFGYDRESQYFYIPLGVTLAVPMDNGWSVAFNAEYDFFIDGEQKSHLEDVSPALNTLKNDQDDGYGVRGSVRIAKELRDFEFFVEPFVRYWDIDQSEAATVTCGGTPCALGFEPKNNTLETGVRVGGKF
jgi:hypothetical protein